MRGGARWGGGPWALGIGVDLGVLNSVSLLIVAQFFNEKSTELS